MKAIKTTKKKKAYGFDRVPMIALVDAGEILLPVIKGLFDKIEAEQTYPEKWKIGRILPLHKKGSKAEITNYRPITNLCSLSKIYERCILFELERIEKEEDVCLTGANQHGFKKGHSTTTLMLDIQDELSSNLEQGNLIALLSLDLTAAFDTISHALLCDRLISIGLSPKLVDLIRLWLVGRSSYVDCEGNISNLRDVQYGTPQGSVLGPVMFSLYVRPLLEQIDNLKMYADDNYIMVNAKTTSELSDLLKVKVNTAIDWLKKSDLEVNITKTELVVFSRSKDEFVEIEINGIPIKSKCIMKVLGVYFDNHLKWSYQIDHSIKKAKCASFQLRKLKKFFNENELLKIATAFVYSKLYYGACVWFNPYINKSDRNRLLSISTFIIKNCFNLRDWHLVNRKDIHLLANRATPNMICDYYSANMLKSIFDNKCPNSIFKKLQSSYRYNDRTKNSYFPDKSKIRLGQNSFANRVHLISKKLPENWQNLTPNQFKRFSKNSFLSY